MQPDGQLGLKGTIICVFWPVNDEELDGKQGKRDLWVSLLLLL